MLLSGYLTGPGYGRLLSRFPLISSAGSITNCAGKAQMLRVRLRAVFAMRNGLSTAGYLLNETPAQG